MRVFQTYADLQAALDLAPLMPGAFRFTAQYMPAGFRCADCQQDVAFPLNGGGTGYARVDAPDGEAMICYPCASARERADLIERGRGTLYLTGTAAFRLRARDTLTVTDWPGGLKFPVIYHSVGRHNFAGKRYDVRFRGPDGLEWSGTTYGDNTQICHVRRLKRAA